MPAVTQAAFHASAPFVSFVVNPRARAAHTLACLQSSTESITPTGIPVLHRLLLRTIIIRRK